MSAIATGSPWRGDSANGVSPARGAPADALPYTAISYGPELMPDPEFANGTTGWTPNGSITLTNTAGALHAEQTGNATAAYATYTTGPTITAGKRYRIQAKLTASHMADVGSTLLGVTLIQQLSAGTATVDKVITAPTSGVLDLAYHLWNAVVWAPLGATADLDYLRISEVL